MNKMNFSAHVLNVFDEMKTSYEEVKNLMFDLYKNELDDGISKREAEDKLREVSLKIFGLNKDSSRRERERAYRDHARQYFDVIEEVTDWTVSTGLKENEWFNALVNYRNLKEGDTNLFVNEHEEVILSIARMGKRHHDTMLQRLPENTTYSVETDVYGAAVGADIDRYLIGQEDWTKLVDAITKAFVVKIQELIFAEILEAPKKLPAQSEFVQTGALNTTNRKKFNKILQNVSVANDNADVVIMGTMVALQELENLIDVKWVADSQKEDIAKMGRLGNYGRYTLVEIPQRFARNDVTKSMYKDDTLFVFATGDNKLVDMVDVGETLIEEITDRGTANSNIADIMKYEVQRELGVSTRIGRYFGSWTITD
nr:MAG TPA: capsid protein [Bacteriophage sp.]